MGSRRRRGRSGRRPGSPDTRGQILQAARDEFAARGYEGASMRGIGAQAGVDPALVHHYFGTKEQLLTAAIELPFEPAQVATAIADAPAEGRGERMARIFLTVWEDPAGRAPLLALFRSAMAHESAATLLRQFARLVMVGRVAPSLQGPDRELRAEVAASHLIGLALARYVFKIEPLASASVDHLVVLVAPAIQHYFDPDSMRAGDDASDEMTNHSGRRGPWDPGVGDGAEV